MNLYALGEALITLGKLREFYSKEILNMLGVTKIVSDVNICLKECTGIHFCKLSLGCYEILMLN